MIMFHRNNTNVKGRIVTINHQNLINGDLSLRLEGASYSKPTLSRYIVYTVWLKQPKYATKINDHLHDKELEHLQADTFRKSD